MKRQFLGRLLSLFLVGTVVAGVGCKDYDDDITSLNNRIDELTTGQIASVEKQMQSLQNAVDRLDGVDSGLKDEIEALQGKAETQAGEIGKLQEELGKAASASEVEALKKQIETLESDKGKLEKRIEALESARTSLQDEIDAVKGSLANYLTKSDAEATYATKTTVESLSQLLNQIKANYVSAEGLASTLEGYVTDAELADYPTLTVLQEAIRQSETAMKNSLGEAMEPILAKYNFVQKDVLDLEIQDLQEQIDALNGKPDADGSLANIKSRLEALENAEIKYDESNAAFTKGVEDCIGKALANDGAIDQAIANAINGVAGEYEGTMQDLKNLIDGLRMDVDQLLSRIQSLVYVPAYDDHKASVNALYYAPEGEEPVLLANGTVEMTFRVTPVEAAGQLVAAYAAEPEMFSLEMEQVKTRATVPALNIQKVEADETGNGRFIVTALPADFTPDFFTGKVSYSIALRVQKAYDAEAGNDYSANVVSDYVNLVPARADVKAVVLAPAKEDGSIDADRIVAADGEVAYEIPYDDTDMVVELMKGYKLWATDGEAYYDLAQLADMGYSLEAPVVACTSKAFKADGTELESADKGNFEVANGGEEVCDETVKLIAADKSTRNNYLLTEHAYTVAAAYDALNPTFNSRVTIVKTKRGVTLDLLKYVWNYSDFRTVYEAGGEYEGAEREFTLKVTESTLPQDITPENIVTYWNQGGSAVVKAVELDAEGKPTETVDDNVKVVPVAYDADEGYTLRVSGYTFGKRYAVEASSEFENVQVTIAFEAEFVALPEKIEVTLPDATLAYDATEELFVAEKNSVVDELFEQVKDHFTDAAELATSLTRPYYGGSPNSANAFYKAVCGDRTLEKNHWFLDGSNPATITRIAVANDGKMVRPMFVKELKQYGQTLRTFPPEVMVPSIGSPKVIAQVQEALRGVVNDGTARGLKNPYYSVAGKTGTAQIAMGRHGYTDRFGGRHYLATLVGYFPADKPRYSCIVAIKTYNGPGRRGTYYGASLAGPVFRAIADRVYARNTSWQTPLSERSDKADGVPALKSGRADEVRRVARRFDVPYTPERGVQWQCLAKADSTGMELAPLSGEPSGAVPQVVGMGIKEAIYLLEREGLRVAFSGTGCVRSQSIPAGAPAQRGALVVLQLGAGRPEVRPRAVKSDASAGPER